MPSRLRQAVLIERPEDAAAAEPLARGGAQIFSLSPEASFALELRGVPCRLLEDFTPAEKFNAAALSRFGWLDEFTGDLDRRLRTAVPYLGEIGASPAASCYFQLKILVDALASHAQLLTNALQALSPSEVLYTPSRRAPFGTDLFFRDESVYSLLCPEAAALCGARPVALTRPQSFETDPSSPGLLGCLKQTRLWRLLRGLRPLPQMHLPSAGRLMLVLDESHDLPLLLDSLSRDGFAFVRGLGRIPTPRRVSRRALEDIRARSADLWRRLEGDHDWCSRFSFHGMNLYPAARERLELLVRRVPAEFAQAYSAWEDRFSIRKPDCVLTASGVIGHLGRAAALAARRTGAPLILYQEGAGFGMPAYPLHEHADLRDFDLFLAYGGITRQVLEARGRMPSGGIVEVGSCRLDRLRAQTRPGRGLGFIYISTRVAGNIQHHPFNGGTGVYYFDAVRQLVRSFSAFPEQEFLLRPYPDSRAALLRRWLADQGPSLRHCRMSSDAPLSVLLPRTSGIILDFPSTTLLEALITDKPLFLILDPRLTALYPEAERALAKRAVLCRGIEDFQPAFARHLRGERLADFSDPEARRLFATCADDGKSLSRARDAVARACRKVRRA